MSPFSTRALYVGIAVGIWLAGVLGYTVAEGTPLSSTSMPNVIPAFTSRYFGGLIPAVGFMIAALPATLGNGKTGRAPIVATIVAALSVVAWFYAGWAYGMQYQGKTAVLLFVALNVAAFAALAFQAIALRRVDSVPRKFAFHALFWVWIGWFAYPWLGEWP